MGVLDSIQKSLSKTDSNLKTGSGKLFNSNPSQKSGKLGGIAQSVSGITKTATGTVTGVGRTVAKIAGQFGGKNGNWIANKLNGETKTKWLPEKEKDYEQTGLKAFYQRFTGMGGKEKGDINKIDPLNTFECTFTFYPNPKDTSYNNDSTTFMKTLMSQKRINSIKESPRFDYSKNTDDKGKIGGYRTNGDTELDLGMFIQSITIPQIQQDGMEDVKTILGTFPVNGNFVQPDTKKLTMEIVNTKVSLHENLFYSWLKEVTLPYWVYEGQPYTTATIEVDFTEHSNVKYLFFGCRPCSVQMIQPSQESSTNFSRQVQFAFDWMFVVDNKTYESDCTDKPFQTVLETSKKESKADKASKIGNAVAFAATNILKI